MSPAAITQDSPAIDDVVKQIESLVESVSSVKLLLGQGLYVFERTLGLHTKLIYRFQRQTLLLHNLLHLGLAQVGAGREHINTIDDAAKPSSEMLDAVREPVARLGESLDSLRMAIDGIDDELDRLTDLAVALGIEPHKTSSSVDGDTCTSDSTGEEPPPPGYSECGPDCKCGGYCG